MKDLSLVIVFLCLLPSLHSFSQTTVVWNFGNNTSDSTSLPTSPAITNLTVSRVTRGNNNGTTAPQYISNTTQSSGYSGASAGNNVSVASRTGALIIGSGGSSYLEFTLTPDSGYVAAISQVSFGARTTTSGPKEFTIRYNLDGYTTDLATSVVSNTSAWSFRNPVTTVVTTAPGIPVTYRIYGYNGTGSAAQGVSNCKVDDITVEVSIGRPSVVENPSVFYSIPIISSQINLNSVANLAGDKVMIAYNETSNTFGTPVNNVNYAVNATLPGGGKILFKGTAGTYNHTGLLSNHTYYYKEWSYNAIREYSSGVTSHSTTPALSTATVKELVIPQYMGAKTDSTKDSARTTIACCLQFENLRPNKGYAVIIGFADVNETANTYGSGRFYNKDSALFVTPSAANAVDNYFYTDATGNSGPQWFFLQPVSNNTRFDAGKQVNLRIGYAEHDSIFPNNPNYISTQPIYCLDIRNGSPVTASTVDDGAYIKGITASTFSGKYVLAFDNEDGTGTPLFSYQVRNATVPGTQNGTAANGNLSLLPAAIQDIYLQSGTSNTGDFPIVFPSGINNGSKGIKRFEFRNQDNSLFAYCTDNDAIWDDGITLSNTAGIQRAEVQTISFLQGVVNNFGIQSNLTLKGNFQVNGIFDIGNNYTLNMAGKTLTLKGVITGDGSLKGTTASNLILGGTNGGSIGTLKFQSGFDTVYNFTMNRIQSSSSEAVSRGTMGSNLTIINDLNLTSGIIATGENLVTWTHSGNLTAPNIPWSQGQTNYSTSYIATCNENGVETSVTNGTMGFRVNNVGNSQDVYFPVGADFVSANRMMINNAGTTDNFTVVVGKGDIANTPKPRVNRIWYVTEAVPGGSRATMQLFFKKIDNPTFGTQDEVEDGFVYSDVHLVQETLQNQFINNSNGTDIQNFIGFTPNTEIYGKFTRGVSTNIDNSPNPNGVTQFSRFSVVNAEGVILPVSIIHFSGFTTNGISFLTWTALNDESVMYVIERSSDGKNFSEIGTVSSKNGKENHYDFNDTFPVQGTNYYRLKAKSSSGNINYSHVIKTTNNDALVNFYPNPATSYLNVVVNDLQAGKWNLIFWDMDGRKIYQKNLTHTGGALNSTIFFNRRIKSGSYQVSLQNAENNFIAGKVIIY